MPTKTYTFDNIPEAGEIELELTYTYQFRKGRYTGAPENCFPDEDESSIILPIDWEKLVMLKYILAGQQAIKKIESQVEDMEIDNIPRVWARESLQDNTDGPIR